MNQWRAQRLPAGESLIELLCKDDQIYKYDMGG